MQLALSTTIAPPPVPVWGELSGNLRQGFTTKNQGWNPGPNVVNSTTQIGLRPGLFLEGFGQSHSARYYNPLTGRFLSRDPEDGIDTDPATLHKYTYAEGDPVNRIDPTGRTTTTANGWFGGGETGEYAGATLILGIRNVVAATVIAAAEICVLQKDADILEGISQNLGYRMTFKSEGACHEKVESCKTKYPKLLPIEDVPWWYEFDSQGEAALALQMEVDKPILPKGRPQKATKGPCPVGGEYTPGWHAKYQTLKGGEYAGSVVGCPVCDDSSGEPIEAERWGVFVEH